ASIHLKDHGQVTARKTQERQHTHLIFLNPERAILHDRIATRVRTMLANGLLEEVRGLLSAGCPPDAKPMQAIGYREVVASLNGRADSGGEFSPVDLDAVAEQITIATRQYAKRQTTWFKGAGPDQTVGSFADYKSVIAGLCALR
ncbi:MAG: hypothetical protein EBU49_11300, partial [Proteobacteria bacterium]|nr:hypothetical protein [Pseudomonadota bacterium]